MSEKKFLTIGELLAMPVLNPSEVINTFEDYVRTGSSVGIMAWALVDRDKVTFDDEQKAKLRTLLLKGSEDQDERGFPRCSDEYLKVAKVLDKL